MNNIYLILEADSGSQLDWPGPSRLRPITRRGWRQARSLADELGRQPILRIVASPFLRCRQTVQPLADQLGLEVHSDRDLGADASVERATARAIALWDVGPTVICTHPAQAMGILDRLSLDGFAQVGRCARSSVPAWVLEPGHRRIAV